MDAARSGFSEHLLIWSWRRIVRGRLHCPILAQELAEACGAAGGEVLLALCTFLRALGAASRRRLDFNAPNPFGVTADERQVLTLLAAAQVEDQALFEAHLRWLAGPQHRHELKAAAHALAALLKASRLPLALPQCAEPDALARAPAIV